MGKEGSGSGRCHVPKLAVDTLWRMGAVKESTRVEALLARENSAEDWSFMGDLFARRRLEKKSRPGLHKGENEGTCGGGDGGREEIKGKGGKPSGEGKQRKRGKAVVF
ncbi:hypothetical protein HPP92_016276 [Vanilla planifolia]|uniref:Uncharacterized protein n=1 Tax=Vanilla planifolia TaxID=51239 RepID=A0A835QEY0_VANPL|nr:hypothetical protein HPP92_016276 [Vanilla planifolia]